MTTQVKVMTKGQIVIPKRIRDALGIKPNSFLYIDFDKDSIYIKPTKEINQAFGMFKEKVKAKSISKEQEKKAVEEYLVNKFKTKEI